VGHSSVIAAGTELFGRLTSDSDVHFSGRLIGEIAIQGELTVAADGRVEGPLRARTVTVSGGVRGAVRGEERVEVLRGGSVEGDIASPCVVLGEGSVLDGRIAIAH